MEHFLILLVDWGMGALLIGVFALVCITLVLIVLNMIKGDSKKSETDEE